MSIVSIKDLLNAGVHFGHQQRFWNPKMESFIFDTRKKISIIDLEMTQEYLNAAASKAEEICSKGNRILFVGTKRSASKTIKESASSIGLPYIDKRWLGGTLTNWKTIRGSIRRLLDIEELQSSGRINKLSKKEAVDITKEYEKLDASVGGIKDMKGLPDALFVVDVAYEKIAVTEAKKMGIPIIALVDTNSNPEGIDHIIPGNDDAIRSIRLITKVISDACARGLASSQGGALNIQTDDEAPAVKVKKAAVTTGKALNLVEEAELSEPEEDLPTEIEEAIEESSEEMTEKSDESISEPDEMSAENQIASEDAVKDSKEEKMSITASQVKELREMTGVGMMECKKALVETDGDLEMAIDLLRANSSLKAEKKASRVAADGEVKIAENSDYTSLVEINSETDFAAKDSQFKDFANDVAEHLASNQVNDIADLNSAFEEKRQSLIQSIGENIQLRRLETLEVPSGGCIGSYVHSDGRLAALVSIDSDNKELAKDLAMHVSATNPSCLQSEDIDPELLERERSIFLAQAEESGKDASIMEKMVEGKVKRFLSEVTLVSQGFVKNPDQSIEELLKENSTSIISFARFKVGEGIEVEVKDFAAEVAEQLQQ